MKITKRQLKRIIKEEYSRLKKQGLVKESPGQYKTTPGSMFAVDIEDPIIQSEDMGMSFGEYIQMYIDAAHKAGVEIVQNTPNMFTVRGSEAAIVEYGFQVNQMEGGPSFNEAEFREYAMYEI